MVIANAIVCDINGEKRVVGTNVRLQDSTLNSNNIKDIFLEF